MLYYYIIKIIKLLPKNLINMKLKISTFMYKIYLSIIYFTYTKKTTKYKFLK